MKLTHFILIHFLALLLFSCESDSKKVDPLFYQISVADSARCMNEIFGEIREQAKENQKRQDEFDGVHMICCFMSRDHMRIRINSAGELRNNYFSDSTNVEENVFEGFMSNRNLTDEETAVASMDWNHPGYNFLFYNRFSFEEIQRKIKETQNQADEIKSVDGADPVLVEYYVSKVDEWEQMQRSIDVIDGQTLSQTSPQARVTLEYQESTIKIKEVLKDIALTFYQMRNYECMRYFGETYLNLFDRQKRQKRKNDIEKVEALRYLHPSMIFVYNNENPRRVIPALPIEKMN